MNVGVRILIALCALAVSKAGAQLVPPGIAESSLERIEGGLYAYQHGPYRSIFLVTSEGVIATDPMSVQAARAYREAIASVTELPVRYLVYSHAHWDHAAGGAIFRDEGATIVAQRRCAENISASPNPDVVMPDVLFDAHMELELGDGGMGLYYFGPSHGTCLAVMIPRPYEYLFTVDIVSPPSGWYMPWDPVVADFHFYNAVAYLEALRSLAAAEGIGQIIGAHVVPVPDGPGRFRALPSVGPISAVDERIRFWRTIMALVKNEMDAGTPSFMVPARIEPGELATARGYDDRSFRLLAGRIAAYYAIGK